MAVVATCARLTAEQLEQNSRFFAGAGKHLAVAGFIPEAYATMCVCRATRGSERILEWVVNISFRNGLSKRYRSKNERSVNFVF